MHRNENGQDVVIIAPVGNDAAAINRVLSECGIDSVVCEGPRDALTRISQAGALLITQEALEHSETSLALDALRAQPSWSELPLILLTEGGEIQLTNLFDLTVVASGNVTILERPVGTATLVRSVQVALRSRRRQYQVRDLLESERVARGAAERATHLKDEFLATVSHELRAPLNAILGWTSVVRRRPNDADTVAEGLGIIDRNARAQARMIEDLLDLSRIISGKIRLEVQTVHLISVIDQALETVEAAAEAKGIQIQRDYFAVAGPIKGDENRLQQVVWNLLSNAVKFTPKGGFIKIQLDRVNDDVEIRVIDNGSGIRPEFLPFVFERFRQEDASTTRKHGGLGLGLAIVKQIAELHGGTVGVRSAGEGHGAEFSIRLPLASDSGRGGSFAPFDSFDESQHVSLKGSTVLVVDDDENACEILRRILAESNAHVHVAYSVSEALQKLVGLRPDLLIGDIGMPERDGYDMIRTIRSSNILEVAQVPAVAVTAFARSQDRAAALEAGFNMHIPKPVEPRELLAAAASLIQKKSSICN